MIGVTLPDIDDIVCVCAVKCSEPTSVLPGPDATLLSTVRLHGNRRGSRPTRAPTGALMTSFSYRFTDSILGGVVKPKFHGSRFLVASSYLVTRLLRGCYERVGRLPRPACHALT